MDCEHPNTMKTLVLASLSVFAFLFAGASQADAAPELKREILGLRIEMPKGEVTKRLQEMGKFVRDERKRQQIWEVRDERFSHVVVGFDSKEMLRYVTAVAREDKEAKRVEYGEIGDVQQAHQAGDPAINNFNFEWRLEPEKGSAEVMVVARGRDPKFLSTYSLKKLGGEVEEEEEAKAK
jgi:hypothetical protein